MPKTLFAGRFLAVACALLFIGLALPSAAQQNDDSSRRLDRVDRELRALQRKVFGNPGDYGAGENAGQSAEGALATQQRITALEQQLAQLTGQIEEANHKSDQNAKKLDAFIKDAEFRFQQLEKGGGGLSNSLSGGATPDDAAAAGPSETRASTPGGGSGILVPPPGAQASSAPEKPAAGKLPPGSALEQYNYARKLLDQGDYANAEGAFQGFIDSHGNDELVGNAYYWLGRTYFVQDKYKQAASSFLDGYKKFPKGVKGADNLLSLGVSLAAMDQKSEACQTLAAVPQQYPNLSAQMKTRVANEKKKAGCK